mmetsp:Transcript_747/g.1722  ORF Transcript_747/g.1722 Transcript_747/m.1722 type:complete len:244 (-) Transcript_747:73-804(-)
MDNTEIGSLVAASLCILFGLLLCFAGYFLFRIAIFLTTFLAVASLLYPAIVEPVTDLEPWLAGLIAILAGLVIALLALCIWPIGVFLTGAWAGFLIGCVIMSTVNGGLIQVDWGAYLFLSLMALLCGILAVILQRPVVILATAISGAYLFLAGIDGFVYLLADHKGGGSFWLIVPFLMQGKLDQLDADWITWLFCALWVVFSIAGAIVQFAGPGRHYNHHHHHRGVVLVIQNDRGYEKIDTLA